MKHYVYTPLQIIVFFLNLIISWYFIVIVYNWARKQFWVLNECETWSARKRVKIKISF